MINDILKGILSTFLLVLLLQSCNNNKAATDQRIGVVDGAIILEALQDFELESSSVELVNRDTLRGALAMDVKMHMDTFAQAEYISNEQSQLYDIQLFTMLEIDGESVFAIDINDQRVGEFTNPDTRTDFLLHVHRVDGVQIDKGDTITVGFGSIPKSIANNNIDESDGHGYTGGRWSKLILTPSS